MSIAKQSRAYSPRAPLKPPGVMANHREHAAVPSAKTITAPRAATPKPPAPSRKKADTFGHPARKHGAGFGGGLQAGGTPYAGLGD